MELKNFSRAFVLKEGTICRVLNVIEDSENKASAGFYINYINREWSYW